MALYLNIYKRLHSNKQKELQPLLGVEQEKLNSVHSWIIKLQKEKVKIFLENFSKTKKFTADG